MNYVIKQILKKKKITDYLDKKGIRPVGQPMGGKVKYLCPIHKSDTSPSFMVYTNDEYENFFCFGCKQSSNIIHLYKALEKVSYKEAISKLSQDLDINIDSEIDDAVFEIETELNEDYFNVSDYAIMLSQEIYVFNQVTNYKWFEATEKIFKNCDKLLQNNSKDIKRFYEDVHQVLAEKKVLPK